MVAALGRDCVADSLFILSASDCAVPESLHFRGAAVGSGASS
jgi:hypothetical protein